MTKSFTAISILKLRDEGKLSLDDPAEKYVPELKTLVYPTSDSPMITIRLLLSHATGFPEDNPWGDQQLADTDDQLAAMIRSGIPFSNAPAVAYEYSNYGFMILGRIVGLVSDQHEESDGVVLKYVTEHVLNPLGMTSTTLQPSSVPADRLAHGYRWEDGRWKTSRCWSTVPGDRWAACSQRSRISDGTSGRFSPHGRHATVQRRDRFADRHYVRCSRYGVRRPRR
jgi:CubicO group peptidase (beta-lactamase class C family)